MKYTTFYAHQKLCLCGGPLGITQMYQINLESGYLVQRTLIEDVMQIVG